MLGVGFRPASRGGVLQAKLTVSQPGDAYEQEAERVADQIVTASSRMQRPSEQRPRAAGVGSEMARLATPSEVVGDDAAVQATSAQRDDIARRAEVGTDFARHLDATSGSELAQPTRGFMEGRFGAAFGGVRVHADSQANQLAGAIGARAFAYGSDIFFAEGQYRPTTPAGQHLLAHELTHVVQHGDVGSAAHARTIAEFQANHPASHMEQLQRQVLDASNAVTVRQRGGSAILRDCFGPDEKAPATIPESRPQQEDMPKKKQVVDGDPNADPAYTKAFAGSALSVKVNVTNVAGASKRSAEDVFEWANQNVYAQANMALTKGTELTLDDEQSRTALDREDLVLNEYGDSSDPTAAHKRLFRFNQSSGATTVYFVHSLSRGSLGEAFAPSKGHGFTGAAISNQGSPQTVAHEIGHVLLDPGPHEMGQTGKNLMHPTDGMDKTELTLRQINRMRESGFAQSGTESKSDSQPEPVRTPVPGNALFESEPQPVPDYNPFESMSEPVRMPVRTNNPFESDVSAGTRLQPVRVGA